jgi:uncharacterized membrane protein YeaQ/YmgE (transglycosylase-associated protein family)
MALPHWATRGCKLTRHCARCSPLDQVPDRWFIALLDWCCLIGTLDRGAHRIPCGVLGRSLIGLCAGFGLFVGGFIPELWGASSFSLISIVFSLIGAIAGIWLGVRLSDY